MQLFINLRVLRFFPSHTWLNWLIKQSGLKFWLTRAQRFALLHAHACHAMSFKYEDVAPYTWWSDSFVPLWAWWLPPSPLSAASRILTCTWEEFSLVWPGQLSFGVAWVNLPRQGPRGHTFKNVWYMHTFLRKLMHGNIQWYYTLEGFSLVGSVELSLEVAWLNLPRWGPQGQM